jgi:hypothetical protein
MSQIKTGIAAHDTTCNLAESARQVADDKARSVITSCIANGLQYAPFSEALHRLTGSYS